jgi:hypothetical protein
MLQVKNNKTGTVEELADDSMLPEMVASGDIQIPNQDYEFETPEGEKYSVGAKGFLQAVNQGWKYRDNSIKREEEMESKYGSQTAKALLYGGARGLTLGLSDVALTKTGLESEEALSEIKSRNETASIGSELVGTVAPIFLSAGSGFLAKGASKTLPALLETGASKLGKRAAENVTSNVAKKAISLGIEGATEGAAIGLGQAISEAALGDAEFNAESVLTKVGTGALTGGVLGGTIGVGGYYGTKAFGAGKKAIQRKLVNQLDGDADFKKTITDQLDNADAMDDGLLALKDPEIQRIKEQYPDAPVTKGMESALKPIKNVENYLFDAPTLQGESIRESAKNLTDYVEKNVNEIFSGSRDASKEETGDLIRQTFFTNINEPRQKGAAFYNDLMGEFGGVPVSQRYRTELSNIIKNSDAYRIGSEGADIKRVLGIVDDQLALLAKHAEDLELLGLSKRQIKEIRKDGGVSAKINKELNESGVNLKEFNNTLSRQAAELPKTNLTLRQIKNLQQDIQASAKVAKGAERQLLNEASDKLRGMQDSVIRDAVGGKGPAAEKIVKGLDAANKDYVQAYKAKEEIAELFGVKGKDFDSVLEKLESMSAIDLEKKFLNIKKSDKANAVLNKYPEIGKLVLANRQASLLKKNMIQGGSEINYAGLKKDLLKMDAEERAIFFGGDDKQEKRMIDMLTLYERRPKTLNPSGTDIRKELREMLSPKNQVQNWMLGEVYKGNDSFFGKMVNKVMPNLSGIEQAANSTKNKVSRSIADFIKSTKAGVSNSTLEVISDKEIRKASKLYDEVQTNPQKVIDDFNKNNASLLEAAPETYQNAQNKIIAGIQFLQSKSPKQDEEYMYQNREPSRAEMITFSDYVEAVENPNAIFKQISQGYINPRTVEALKVVYPKIYQALVSEFIARKPKVLSRTQMTEAQKLLGSRVMPAMDRDKFEILQRMTPESQAAGQAADQMMTPKVSSTQAGKMKTSERSRAGTFDSTIYRS